MHAYAMEYYSAIKKENPAICINIDEPGGRYAKWNKIDNKGQILHGITYTYDLKQNTHINWD